VIYDLIIGESRPRTGKMMNKDDCAEWSEVHGDADKVRKRMGSLRCVSTITYFASNLMTNLLAKMP
jgi:hypothetical protein